MFRNILFETRCLIYMSLGLVYVVLIHLWRDSFIWDMTHSSVTSFKACCLYTYMYIYIHMYSNVILEKKKHVMMWHVTHTQREFESSFQFKWDTRLIREGDSINKRGRLDSNSLGWTNIPCQWVVWKSWTYEAQNPYILMGCDQLISKIRIYIWLVHIKNLYIRIRHDSFVSYERDLVHIWLCMMPHTYIRRMRTYLIRVWLYMTHELYATWRLHRTYASLVCHEHESCICITGMAH